MTNRHWLEGLIANTCAERSALPGYGAGEFRELGWLGLERRRWRETLGIEDEKLSFFKIHGEADVEHSEIGWNAVSRFATDLRHGGRGRRGVPGQSDGLGELLERHLRRRRPENGKIGLLNNRLMFKWSRRPAFLFSHICLFPTLFHTRRRSSDRLFSIDGPRPSGSFESMATMPDQPDPRARFADPDEAWWRTRLAYPDFEHAPPWWRKRERDRLSPLR